MIDDVCTVGMVDSGNSFHTAISKELAERLGIRTEELKTVPGKEMVGTAEDGAQLKVLGQVRKRLMMRLPADSPTIIIKPFVLEGLAMPLNISGPLMELCDISIKVGKYVKFKKHRILMAMRPTAETKAHVAPFSPLYIAQDIEVPPRSMIHLPVMIPPRMIKQYSDSKIVVMADEKLLRNKKGVMAFNRTMVKTQSHDGKWYAKVGMMNETSRPVYFWRGTLYGKGYPVADQDESNPEPWKISIIGNLQQLREKGKQMQEKEEKNGQREGVINAHQHQFKLEGQNKKLEEWMEGPITKSNIQRRSDHLVSNFKIDENDNLKEGDRRQHLIDLLLYFWEVFSWDGRIGNTDLIYHNLTSKAGSRPVRQKVRTIHQALEPSLQQQLIKWLDNKIIEPSDSDWNTNLLALYKPGGDVRWVLDLTALNRVTEIDTFPVGDVLSNLARLGKSKYFSVVDSQGAYHVIPIHPEDRYKTAFLTPWNSFQFRYMPFGMASAGATFCRLNQLIMGKAAITSDEALSYIDDLLILGAGFDEHLHNLYKTMRAYAEAGLLLNPSKCEFAKSEVKYLGHIISEQGTKMMPDYVKAVREWPLPTTRKELRIVLGKMKYYRKFIRGFANIARPLTDKLSKKDEHGYSNDEAVFETSEEYKKAFDELKQALTHAPLLAHPRFDNLKEEPFVMDTDWSEETQCISAALHQRQWQSMLEKAEMKLVERPIAFMSKKLPEATKSYTPMKGELAAVIYYLEYFEYYARTGTIVLRTDHQALLALKNSTEKRGQWARWRQRLALFNYSIEHRKGTSNTNADALSRATHVQRDESTDIDIFNEEEDGLQIHSIRSKAILSFGLPELEQIEYLVDGLATLSYDANEFVITASELKECQLSNDALKEIRQMLKRGDTPDHSMISRASPEMRNWLGRYNQLGLDSNGLIRYHTWISGVHGSAYDEDNGGTEVKLVVLPEEAVYDTR